MPLQLRTVLSIGAWVSAALFIAALTYAADVGESAANRPFRITVVEDDCDWPVPLVELRTTNGQRFVTDNAGVIAFDDPSLMGRPVWFHVNGHGYEIPADGFGYRGVSLTPTDGGAVSVSVTRTNVARRIGRITGTGLFAESQKLGDAAGWSDLPGVGRDSVQLVRWDGSLRWLWGDTTLARYPLGVFHMTAAVSELHPFDLRPPLRPRLTPILAGGEPAAVAQMPGDGPTWLTQVMSLVDADGDEHYVATYRKIEPPLSTYESGLCEWDAETERFKHVATVWRRSSGDEEPPALREGHVVSWTDANGRPRKLIGNPLLHTSLPATYEAWRKPETWQTHTPPASLPKRGGGSVVPHSGSIAWNEYRGRWVTVFVSQGPSALSDVWYAEADSPLGPWDEAILVLRHNNYSFYNPRVHGEMAEPGSPVLLFEGTYTATFADRPQPTPRYDYNQILYRLDLDDAIFDRRD